MGGGQLLVESDLKGSFAGPVTHLFKFRTLSHGESGCAQTHADVTGVDGKAHQLASLVVKRNPIPDFFLRLRKDGPEKLPQFSEFVLGLGRCGGNIAIHITEFFHAGVVLQGREILHRRGLEPLTSTVSRWRSTTKLTVRS